MGYPAAVQEMEESLIRTHAFDDDYTAALLSRSLGESYTRLGDFERAQKHLDDALAYYRRNGMRPYLPGILASMAELREHRGESAEALEAREEAHRAAVELGL